MIYSDSIDFERDLLQKFRMEASQEFGISNQIKCLLTNGANSTKQMLEDTYQEAKLNSVILKYWLSVLLMFIKKNSPSPELKSFLYIDFITYFAKNEGISHSEAIYREFSISLSADITSCSINQLLENCQKLHELSQVYYLTSCIKLMKLRLKQEAFNQMNRFMQVEDINSCSIIVFTLNQCMQIDDQTFNFLNIIIKNILEKFIENHDLDKNGKIIGNDKAIQYQRIKGIFDKVLEIENYFNSENMVLVNNIRNNKMMLKPGIKKRNKGQKFNLQRIENRRVTIYMHKFPTFAVEVSKETNIENKTFIIKNYHSFSDGFIFENVEKEIKIMAFLSKYSDTQRVFIKLYYVHKDQDQICIWMEDGGKNLMNLITETRNKGQKLPKELIEEWIIVLLEGFAWLAANKIYHRDIKPHNLLVNEEEMTLKIIDFGIGDISEDQETTISKTMEFPIQGTAGYMAPEIKDALDNRQRSAYYKPEKSDVFSLGLTFYQLITFENIQGLSTRNNNRELMARVSGLDCSFWVKELLKHMLEVEWRSRFRFNRLLSLLPSEKTNFNQ